MDWVSCKKKKLAKEIKVDNNLINSLIGSSSKKFKTQSMIKLNNDTAASKISLTYESLRELLEALAISRGYKIYNHECYFYFLKEVLNEDLIAKKFNSFRKIRNDIDYYGKDINSNEAKIIINDIVNLIKKIKILNEKG